MKNKFKETLSNILSYLLKVERRTLLWENPNPNTGFGAQTISLDLSEFDAVEIEAYYVSTDVNNRTLYSNRLPFGTAAVLAPQGQGRAISARKATINNAGITFTTGCLFYSTTEQNSVDVAVPVRIYGIKSGGGYCLAVFSRLSAILHRTCLGVM